MHFTHRKVVLATAIVAALATSLSGCSLGSGKTASSGDSKDKTLTVWAMQGDFTTATLNAINKKFTAQTGAKVKLETQAWSNITTKITTALSTSTPPDVLDLGNTQVSSYAASGGLMDLTSKKAKISQGNTWISGLEDPATVDGKLYAIPAFAAARAVVYNKKIWAAAGITQTPTSWDEFTADLDKIQAKHSGETNFTTFYLPGQYWYSALPFIWDAGGNVAVKSDGKWSGSTSSAASLKGIEEWKAFQNKYSSVASRTLDTDNPDQDQLLADGKTATILSNSSTIAKMSTLNSSVKADDLGTFAMPGQSGKNQPSLVAGSDFAVAAKSQHSALAIDWITIAASSTVQQKWVFGKDGWIPNTVQGLDKALASSTFPAVQRGFFEAAKISKSTPASAKWSTIEGDKSINEFVESIASGTASPQDAAKKFDQHMDSTLN